MVYSNKFKEYPKQVLKSSQGQEKHDPQKSDRLNDSSSGNQKKVDAILNFHVCSEHI